MATDTIKSVSPYSDFTSLQDEFTFSKLMTASSSSWFTPASGITVNVAELYCVAPNLYYVVLDLSGTMTANRVISVGTIVQSYFGGVSILGSGTGFVYKSSTQRFLSELTITSAGAVAVTNTSTTAGTRVYVMGLFMRRADQL